MKKNDETFLDDDWDDALVDQLELVISSVSKTQTQTQTQPRRPPSPLSATVSTINVNSFSPPRELSQRPTHFDKDLEIDRLKRELGRASKQIGDLEKECHNLKKERENKEDQPKIVSYNTEEQNAYTKRLKTTEKDSGVCALDHHRISSKFHNGVSSTDPTVETTVTAKGVEAEMVSHQETQGPPSDYLSTYLDLSQKLVTVWGSPTDKNLGSDVIPKLLAGCQRDFHILFGSMSMSPPSEITRELLTDVSSSVISSYYVKGCFHTPEAAKVSNLYRALTKIADGTYVVETLIAPLLDLCSMENVVIVHSALCILHTLLKLLLELEKDFGRRHLAYISIYTSTIQPVVVSTGKKPTHGSLVDLLINCPDQCTLLRDNVFIEGICIGKGLVDSGGLESVKDGKLFNEDVLGRKECPNYQNGPQPHVNWSNIFDTMHQIAMQITEESVRVETVSIMILLFLRSNAYFEREKFSHKLVFITISELLKKDAGLHVKKHALRLMYLVLNCPKLLATFCCGCNKRDDSSASMDDNASASDFQNFESILQGLASCVEPCEGGLLELKISRNAILVLAFLASSGQPGFEILVDHKVSTKGVNYLMLILQLLKSEMDTEAGAYNELPEILRERTFLIREILILLNRLVSSLSYSATILSHLTTERDMVVLTIDVATRLSRKGNETEHQDGVVKRIRETEIVDLARLFKKRVYTCLGHRT